MSIPHDIAALVLAGKLRKVEPIGSRKRPKRRLYMTASADRDFDAGGAIGVMKLRGDVAAAMEKWVIGGYVEGVPRPSRFLHRLDPEPPEVWEIRVTQPSPQVRIIGRFAERDTFVVTRIHLRSFLGEYGSANWQQAKDQTKAIWDELFPNQTVHSGTWMHHYVGEEFDDYELQPQRPHGKGARALRHRPRS